MPGMQDLADHNALTAMGAHTSGPWFLEMEPTEVAGVEVRFNVRSTQRVCIAGGQSQEHLLGDGIHKRECEANARLIAAAPDLLEALIQYAEVYSEHWKPGMPILEPMSDAAIAKATGGAQ